MKTKQMLQDIVPSLSCTDFDSAICWQGSVSQVQF